MFHLQKIFDYVGVSNRVARESSWSFVLKVISTGLGFGTTVLLARLLGVAGYGTYAFAYALITLLALPAQAGLPNLVLRETARGISQGNPEVIKGIWKWSAKVAFSVSSGIMILVGLVICLKGLEGTRELTILVSLPLVPSLALVALVSSALRGLKEVIAGQVPESIVRPGLLLIFLFFSRWLFHLNLSPPLAMIFRVLAGIFAFIIGVYILWCRIPQSVRGASEHPHRSASYWRKSAVIFALIAGFSVISNQASTVILGLFVIPSEVGIFRVAVQLASLAAFGLQAVNMVVAPRFAGIYATGDLKYLQYVVKKSAQVVLCFSLFVTFFFALSGKLLLGLLFGAEYISGFVPLIILLGGQLVNSVAGSVGLLLNMTGNEAKTARGMALAGLTNISFNLILIPYWGAIGAAIATATSLVVWNCILWIAARRYLGINSLAFDVGGRGSVPRNII